ncbi:MAG: dihydroxyacetone kinase phosphoryl donor subunit DhaM [Caldilineaceae bacterium]
MIGIVIVAHSAALAAGVRALVTQMTGDRVPIAAAGGSTNADEPIGTDPMLVLEAIDAVDQGDDILVLMDLGSAIMSAEAALEFLDDDVRARVYLCEAPVAEGALAAAVQAAAGSDIARVMAEARASLQPKAAQLAPLLRIKPPAAPVTDAVPPAAPEAAAHQITVTVPNRLGLHARPAARLVETAARFDAWVRYTCNGRHAAGDSINQIATLGARQGDQLTVATGGPEAEAVLRAVEALAAANFGDTDDAPPAPVAGATAVDAPPGAVTGGSVVPGIALGPALALDRTLPAVETRSIDDPPAEQARLDRAMAGVGAELEAVVVRTRARMAAGDAGIIDAQLLILRDPALAAAARTRIAAAEICAEAAWVAAIQEIVAQYRALADPYMRQRAADVLDIGRRVLAQLTGAPQTVMLDAPAVVVAHEVGPLDVAQFDPDRVLGVVTAVGGATGHAAILLRGLGIPTVMGVGAVDAVETEALVGLDGARGFFWPYRMLPRSRN